MEKSEEDRSISLLGASSRGSRPSRIAKRRAGVTSRSILEVVLPLVFWSSLYVRVRCWVLKCFYEVLKSQRLALGSTELETPMPGVIKNYLNEHLDQNLVGSCHKETFTLPSSVKLRTLGPKLCC